MSQTKKKPIDSWDIHLSGGEPTNSIINTPPNPFSNSLACSHPLNSPGSLPKSPKMSKTFHNTEDPNSLTNSPFKNRTHSSNSSYSSMDSSPQFLMNYSPKHSRKPSSLSSNRNINMKNLSLNLEDKERKKSLTLSIPTTSSPQSPFISTITTNGSNASHGSNGSYTNQNIQNTSSSSCDSSTTSKSSFDEPHPLSPKDTLPAIPSLGTSKNYKFPDDQVINDFRSLSVKPKPRIPEELQELSQLDAYVNGPANVLNGSIFLYSEPTVEEINNYDLVINVAKECKDLSSQFNPQNLPDKKYVYVPWNHTSSISKELTKITEIIKEFDDSNKDIPPTGAPKRKILVHCQCGVSRSACVIVAYFMVKFKINVNDAYELLKSGTSSTSINTNKLIYEKGYNIDSCSRVCPNMSLIFELMEFYETLTEGV